MNFISSFDNPTIKKISRLQKNGESSKQGIFLVDGEREIFLALQAKFELVNLFYCPELAPQADKFIELSKAISQPNIIQVSSSIFKKICYKEKPEGFLASFKRKTLGIADLKLAKDPLVVVLEKVEKPGNLGAILRTAYAAGSRIIILNDSQTDIYNPNVIRASEGYVFLEQIINLPLVETITWLKKNKITSLAAATNGRINYTDANLAGAVALIFGSEAEGLSHQWLKSADTLIKIPMSKGVDSLNVSVSAAIIIFESLRQRNL